MQSYVRAIAAHWAITVAHASSALNYFAGLYKLVRGFVGGGGAP